MKPDSVSWYSRTKAVPNSRPGVLRHGPFQLREYFFPAAGEWLWAGSAHIGGSDGRFGVFLLDLVEAIHHRLEGQHGGIVPGIGPHVG